MKDFKVIEVKRSIFEDNNADADRLREQLKSEGTFLLNLMSSPGAGKTTTLKRTINMLKDEINIGVMEADIDSDVDAQAITDTGVRAIQIHTGGMCHLDADMTRQGINEFGTKDLDLVLIVEALTPAYPCFWPPLLAVCPGWRLRTPCQKQRCAAILSVRQAQGAGLSIYVGAILPRRGCLRQWEYRPLCAAAFGGWAIQFISYPAEWGVLWDAAQGTDGAFRYCRVVSYLPDSVQSESVAGPSRKESAGIPCGRKGYPQT